MRRWLGCLAYCTLAACGGSGPGSNAAASPGLNLGALPPAAASGTTTTVPEPDPSDGACSSDMVLIAGAYCPAPQQTCVEYSQEWIDETRRLRALAEAGTPGSTNASERCMRFSQPSRCLSPAREPMRFCMDRYEWPNRKGELPQVLVNWQEAKSACEAVGKRLCTPAEFNFACEGEEMFPYSTGYDREPSKCHLDKEYRKREINLARHAKCMEDPVCKQHFEMLDQREPAGSRPECHSVFGVYDLNGNVNEWVEIPGEKFPNRSGLKGGWWGPVRSRCRPIVGFHKEEDYGYEVGFRCCKDSAK